VFCLIFILLVVYRNYCGGGIRIWEIGFISGSGDGNTIMELDEGMGQSTTVGRMGDASGDKVHKS